MTTDGPGKRILIGLDIGGSKTRGIRVVDGSVVTELVAGSANTQNVTPATAARNLAEVLTGLDAGSAASIIVGAGGIDTQQDEDALRELIAPAAPNVAIRIVHDTRLILAAGHAQTGIAVIAGTGSSVWGINAAGAEARVGGWGYLLGDEGSGYWFGREAVRHTLRRADLGLTVDELSTALLRECGLSNPADLIRHFHTGTDRRYWADKSRQVFDAAREGHAYSQQLIQEGGAHLAEQVMQVARRLDSHGPVILGGGLGENQPALRESFAAQLREFGITDVRAITTQPVYGVLNLDG